jgi:glucose/arabinose dehydrogenase
MFGRRWVIITAWVLGLVLLCIFGIYYAIKLAVQKDPFVALYTDNCAVCHGEDMRGGAQGPALLGAPLVHGESVAELTQSIGDGFPAKGMPGWSNTLPDGQVASLAILIAEKRVDRVFTDFKMAKPLEIPTTPFETELASFRLVKIAEGIDPYPFSIAPLPNGRFLVTEKKFGLSIVNPDGTKVLIKNTPETSELALNVLGLDYGLGWLLDVAPHPEYAENGWIYLHHTEICTDCETTGPDIVAVTMNRVIRGRIKGDEWVDEEVIWSVPHKYYSAMPDLGAGGRIAFDPKGYLFISVGMKGGYFEGIQDLTTPYGKIHRVHDDGSIPEDNPFITTAGAYPSTWTYGHRSPQGLEFDATTGKLWETEMGPRGGDELNLLQPGLNFGWPIYSKGVDYDGTPVEYWKDLGIEFDIEDIQQPVADMTPSPAVSSFVIYDGYAFPSWQHDYLVGSLKATELYRLRIRDDKLVSTEILFKDLARIRDIEVDAEGLIYLLLEHESGSQIVRMEPVS